MKYSQQEIIQYVQEEDVKFIRLAFCDVFGKQKNISIMPDELQRAFSYGIAIDASAIDGFGDETHSDLFLHPEPDTLMPLPWRPEEGSVVRMFCHITHQDGTPFEYDSRALLEKAIKAASEEGLQFSFGTEQEFYLFRSDDFGEPTMIPYDHAGYMDIAPEDKGENIRREICLTLEQMGIHPESSHHEQGPGQNEIDFRYSDPMTAADNALTFQTVVKAVALRNGLCADFSPKPLRDQPGNGFHINISVKSDREFNYNDTGQCNDRPFQTHPCIGLDEVLPHRLGGFSRKGGNGDGRNGSIHIQLEHPSIYRKDHDKRQHCDQKASQQRHDPQGDGFQHPYRFDLFHDLCRKLCHTPVCHSRLCHDGRYDPLYNGKQGGHQFHAIHDGALCQCKPDKGFEGMFRLFHVCKAATGLYDPGCKKQYQKSISNGSQRPVDPGDDAPDRPALKGFRALGKERPDFCQLLIPGVQCRV